MYVFLGPFVIMYMLSQQDFEFGGFNLQRTSELFIAKTCGALA